MNAQQSQGVDELNEEGRFVYTTELPSLQEMASCRVTLAIWSSYISRLKYDNPPDLSDCDLRHFNKVFNLYDSYEEDTDELVEKLTTPPRIESLLKASLKKVRSEMKTCFDHYTNYLFSLRGGTNIHFYSDWFVWLPNGEIDYRRTAQKIVSAEDGRLNRDQKFVVMHDCGLEDEARTLSLNSLPDNVFYSSAVGWWLAYLQNEPRRKTQYSVCSKPTSWPFAAIVGDCDIDRTSNIRINRVWHRLTDDDQVLVIYNMIVNRISVYREKWLVAEPLIGSMSWQQQRNLLSMPDAASKIIEASWKYSSTPDCTVWAWMYCRNFISAENFYRMFQSWCVLHEEVQKHAVLSLEKIWDTADEHHRNFMLLQGNGESGFFKLFLPEPQHCFDIIDHSTTTYTLFVKYVAAMKSPEQKVSFTLKHSVRLATGTNDPDNLKRIFDALLPSPNQQMEFKTSVIKSKEMVVRCAKLWRKGDFDVLKAFMKFYFDNDVNAAREYLKRVSKKIVSYNWDNGDVYNKCVITDDSKWHECSLFIDQIFPLDRAEALIIKKGLVSSFLLKNSNRYCSSSMCSYGKTFFHYSEIVMNKVFKTIETVYQNRKEMKPLKTEFIKNCLNFDFEQYSCNNFEQYYCYDVYFHKMIDWCCDDNDEAIAICKEKFNSQDDIFDMVFFQLNKAYVTEAKGLKESLLGYLDRYLSWFLVDEQRVNEYKSRRLTEPNSLEIFSAIRRAKDEQSHQILLEWFFNGDDEKIREFRSKKMKY